MADDILRRCNRCLRDKPQGDFYFRRDQGRFRLECKDCTNVRTAAYVARNREKVADYKRQWHNENADRYRDAKQRRYLENAADVKRRAAEFALANPERVKTYKKLWKKNNPQSIREYQFVRAKARKRATPIWAIRSAMLEIYRRARALTRMTGCEHHVDHIVPLVSASVCGLHCEQNMQILDAFANQSKLNRWWPDMWEPS